MEIVKCVEVVDFVGTYLLFIIFSIHSNRELFKIGCSKPFLICFHQLNVVLLYDMIKVKIGMKWEGKKLKLNKGIAK